jgi:hypothetical protein
MNPAESHLHRALGFPQEAQQKVARLVKMKADGDCLYSAVSAALQHEYSVLDLRAMVSEAVTQETLDMMKACDAAGVEGYSHVRECGGVEQLKQAIRRDAKAARPSVSTSFCFAVHMQTGKRSLRTPLTYSDFCASNDVYTRAITPKNAPMHAHALVIHTCTKTCMHTCMYICEHTCHTTHECMHTCIRTYIT